MPIPRLPGARRWLVTGAAGFIGSHLVEALLSAGQQVVGLDNLVNAQRGNIQRLHAHAAAPDSFRFVEGDIRDPAACRDACAGVHHVLHHAALCSVPASLAEPALFQAVNEGGFHTVLLAARDAGVVSVAYASSSAVYGDGAAIAREDAPAARLLSPYAANKRGNEVLAAAFARDHGMAISGLRYFNVYGPRQDPAGAYAAVIPGWTCAMRDDLPIHVNGRGDTSRDFCFVGDVIQANLAAALHARPGVHAVYNVGCGQAVSLNELRAEIAAALAAAGRPTASVVVHRDYRSGDIRHSCADIALARKELGFDPEFSLAGGLVHTVRWFLDAARTPD